MLLAVFFELAVFCTLGFELVSDVVGSIRYFLVRLFCRFVFSVRDVFESVLSFVESRARAEIRERNRHRLAAPAVNLIFSCLIWGCVLAYFVGSFLANSSNRSSWTGGASRGQTMSNRTYPTNGNSTVAAALPTIINNRSISAGPPGSFFPFPGVVFSGAEKEEYCLANSSGVVGGNVDIDVIYGGWCVRFFGLRLNVLWWGTFILAYYWRVLVFYVRDFFSCNSKFLGS